MYQCSIARKKYFTISIVISAHYSAKSRNNVETHLRPMRFLSDSMLCLVMVLRRSMHSSEVLP